MQFYLNEHIITSTMGRHGTDVLVVFREGNTFADVGCQHLLQTIENDENLFKHATRLFRKPRNAWDRGYAQFTNHSEIRVKVLDDDECRALCGISADVLYVYGADEVTPEQWIQLNACLSGSKSPLRFLQSGNTPWWSY